jgi:hypothetical protein
MDEKKANHYLEGLTIQLQDCLVQSPNLSYIELVSAAIDQERTMKAVAKVEEKKRMVPESSTSGGSSGAPPKYRMVYTPPQVQLRRPQQQQYWGNHQQYEQWQF